MTYSYPALLPSALSLGPLLPKKGTLIYSLKSHEEGHTRALDPDEIKLKRVYLSEIKGIIFKSVSLKAPSPSRSLDATIVRFDPFHRSELSAKSLSETRGYVA